MKGMILVAAFMPLLLAGCGSLGVQPQGPRSIVLDGLELTESEPGEFDTWKCEDYVARSGVIVELGKLNASSETGFILFDGTNAGALASYRRQGLDHRWNWGLNSEESYDFSIIVRTDGTGLYYDFTAVDPGENITARDVFYCRR